MIIFATQNAQFNILLCFVAQPTYRISHLLLLPGLMVRVYIIPCTRLSHIDSSWAICGQPSCKWISAFQAVTNTATIIPTTTPNPTHSHAEHLSTQKTDRPSLHHTPRPDMQFISWKTCRRAKPGRAFYLVSLQQPLLSMLYLDSFHPPADMRVSMSPPQ